MHKLHIALSLAALAIIAVMFVACSIAISQVHTDGTASDVIDSEQHSDAQLNADMGAI